MLHRILVVGLLAGLLAGAAGTALQLAWAVPLILRAETLEQPADSAHAANHAHAHPDRDAHGHGEPWAPAAGTERRLWTLASNIGVGVGAGFIFAAVLALRRGPLGARRGLAWGALTFVCVGVAPALGLPPELPGSAAAPLDARQAWWLLAAIATAGGLVLLIGRRPAAVRAAGAGLLLLPHLVGAPQPAVHASLAPEALQREFVVAALACSALFWLVLGAAAGGIAQRLGLGIDDTAAHA